MGFRRRDLVDERRGEQRVEPAARRAAVRGAPIAAAAAAGVRDVTERGRACAQ
jgi:hypothetical protein